MTSDRGVERRVGPLENDSAALYELLDLLRGDFTAFRTEIKAEFTDVWTEIKGELTDVRTDIRAELTAVRTELTSLKTEVSDSQTETRSRFDGIEATLVEVVRRLPEAS